MTSLTPFWCAIVKCEESSLIPLVISVSTWIMFMFEIVSWTVNTCSKSIVETSDQCVKSIKAE